MHIYNPLPTLSNFAGAVYTHKHDWMNPKLSGVGIRAPLADLAPIDAEASYNDPDLDPSCVIDIYLLKTNFSTMSFAPLTAPSPQWGFPFHASCWNLLTVAQHPGKVNIQLLNHICRSCPTQFGRLNWGHNFGGLMEYGTDPKNLLPGEDRRLAGQLNPQLTSNESFGDSLFFANPLDVPHLQQLLDQNLKPKEVVDQMAHKYSAPDQSDCFPILPLEILQEILLYLPSKDVLNLKLASVVFAPMPLSSVFWASRFQYDF